MYVEDIRQQHQQKREHLTVFVSIIIAYHFVLYEYHAISNNRETISEHTMRNTIRAETFIFEVSSLLFDSIYRWCVVAVSRLFFIFVPVSAWPYQLTLISFSLVVIDAYISTFIRFINYEFIGFDCNCFLPSIKSRLFTGD